MEMLTNTDFDFEIWYNSFDPNFTEISLKSMIPRKWVSFDRVADGPYKNSIIKPTNKYVEALYPAPKLISIEDGIVTLRQHTHAGIFLLEEDKKLKALDRPWMRQFYQSKNSFKENNECFDDVFVFYVPWFIDAYISITFRDIEGSPFRVYPTASHYEKVPAGAAFVEPRFVPFRFLKVGEHMERDGFGKILKGSPMFDMVFQADDTIIEKIKEFYEHN
jgi:hypothetical protein